MQQVLSTILLILIVAAIGLLIIGINKGYKFKGGFYRVVIRPPKVQYDNVTDIKKKKKERKQSGKDAGGNSEKLSPGPFQKNGGGKDRGTVPPPAHSAARMSPQPPWGFELIRDYTMVKRYIPIPDCTSRDVTVGGSPDCTIRIDGCGDVCDEHIIIRRDNEGVFLIASYNCSENVIVDGRLVFNPEGIKNEDERLRRVSNSKTYLRDGMQIEVGTGLLRAVSGPARQPDNSYEIF